MYRIAQKSKNGKTLSLVNLEDNLECNYDVAEHVVKYLDRFNVGDLVNVSLDETTVKFISKVPVTKDDSPNYLKSPEDFSYEQIRKNKLSVLSSVATIVASLQLPDTESIINTTKELYNAFNGLLSENFVKGTVEKLESPSKAEESLEELPSLEEEPLNQNDDIITIE